MFTKVKIF